jgi:hypothetical protein
MAFIKFGYLNTTGHKGDFTDPVDSILSIWQRHVRQKIPAFLRKPKGHYRIQNSPVLVPVPSKKNVIHVV